MAYNKYLQDYQKKLTDYEMLEGREQFEYSKYLDELSQYEANKNFDYAKWLDEIDYKANEATRIANERSAALSEAYAAAEYGDFSKLEALGINPDYEYLAQLAAGKNSGTINDVTETGGGVPADIVSVINSRYPGGVVTDDNVWNDLVAKYGEAALKDAGITKSFENKANVLDVADNPILNRLPNGLNAGPNSNAWDVAKINDVYSNVAILVDMMNKGDDEIKTVNDVKSAILEVYPQYANDAYFATLLNEMILELTKKTPTATTSTKNTSGGGGGKINAVSMSEVR